MLWAGPAPVPDGTKSYPELIEIVTAIPVPDAVTRSTPVLLCPEDQAFCANAVRYEFTIPEVTATDDACGAAYEILAGVVQEPLIVVNFEPEPASGIREFTEQCRANLASVKSVTVTAAGRAEVLGNSTVSLDLHSPDSGASRSDTFFNGAVRVYNQSPTSGT